MTLYVSHPVPCSAMPPLRAPPQPGSRKRGHNRPVLQSQVSLKDFLQDLANSVFHSQLCLFLAVGPWVDHDPPWSSASFTEHGDKDACLTGLLSAIYLPDAEEPIKSPSGPTGGQSHSQRDLGLRKVMCEATRPPGIPTVDFVKSRPRLLLREVIGTVGAHWGLTLPVHALYC